MRRKSNQYGISFTVITGLTVLIFLLIHADLPFLAHVITFNLIFWLSTAEAVRWKMQEEVEHAES